MGLLPFIHRNGQLFAGRIWHQIPAQQAGAAGGRGRLYQHRLRIGTTRSRRYSYRVLARLVDDNAGRVLSGGPGIGRGRAWLCGIQHERLPGRQVQHTAQVKVFGQSAVIVPLLNLEDGGLYQPVNIRTGVGDVGMEDEGQADIEGVTCCKIERAVGGKGPVVAQRQV